MKWDPRMARFVAASLATTFGSLWLTFYLSGVIATEPPEFTILRHVSMVLFFATTIWGLYLYFVHLREERRTRDNSHPDSNDAYGKHP